ncbi:MAG: hypothetical protein EOM23_06705, partial [Candidatus Moranbacteria bacterium]|nr:hypothetical protein [Candidatus Moranbacteria bacterium]
MICQVLAINHIKHRLNIKKQGGKKMVKMPSIEQFRQIVKKVRMKSEFQRLDENGEPIYIKKNKYPVVKAIGTVKVHGTNASIAYNPKKGMWCQSKNNVITPEKDNAGFAAFVKERQDFFEDIMGSLQSMFCYMDDTITLFGEFAGKGVQKGVAISEIDKSFFIFGARLTDAAGNSVWVKDVYFKTLFKKSDIEPHNVYVLHTIKTYEVEIDFNAPEKANNE